MAGSGGITLAPLTEDEREAFFREEIANYADQQIRDAGWQPGEALDRARREFTPVLAREYDEGVAAGDRLWSANVLDGGSVGWLWIKPLDDAPVPSAYLEQITVAATRRRQGYGRAMLAALEELLAAEGVEEVRLDVYAANEAGQAFYAGASYELVGRSEHQVQLRKQLSGAKARAE